LPRKVSISYKNVSKAIKMYMGAVETGSLSPTVKLNPGNSEIYSDT